IQLMREEQNSARAPQGYLVIPDDKRTQLRALRETWKIRPPDVLHAPAALANKMMMPLNVSVEPRGFPFQVYCPAPGQSPPGRAGCYKRSPATCADPNGLPLDQCRPR